MVVYCEHESPSRLDFLSFPNSRQCNATIKIFQRARANKFEPFNWSIETMLLAIRVIKFDYFLRSSFFFFLFPPKNTEDLRMTNRISSFESQSAEHSRESVRLPDAIASFVLFWLIIFINAIVDRLKPTETNCACWRSVYDPCERAANRATLATLKLLNRSFARAMSSV